MQEKHFHINSESKMKDLQNDTKIFKLKEMRPFFICKNPWNLLPDLVMVRININKRKFKMVKFLYF